MVLEGDVSFMSVECKIMSFYIPELFHMGMLIGYTCAIPGVYCAFVHCFQNALQKHFHHFPK